MRKLSDFKKENSLILKKLELATIQGAKQASGPDSCFTETSETDADGGGCDTRYYNYSDTSSGTKLVSTYVL